MKLSTHDRAVYLLRAANRRSNLLDDASIRFQAQIVQGIGSMYREMLAKRNALLDARLRCMRLLHPEFWPFHTV